jgi:transposase
MNPTPHDWKEARRLQAWHLTQQGWSQHQIAAALGVSEGAVSQWMKRARAFGATALRHRPYLGAAPRLSPDQLARLPELLHRGAEAYGFRGQVWTRSRIAALIHLAFGIWYNTRHVGRLCLMIHWSPPKNPSGAPANATKRRLPTGARTRGPPSKEGASPAADDPLHR